MKYVLQAIVIAGVLLLQSLQANATAMTPDTLLSDKISENLRATFADQRKFLVQVWSKTDLETSAAEVPQDTIDLGYMTYAFAPRRSQLASDSSDQRKWMVSVKTNSPLSNSDQKLIEETVRFTTAGLKSEISISKGDFREPKPIREPASAEKAKDDAKNDAKNAEAAAQERERQDRLEKRDELDLWLKYLFAGISLAILLAVAALLRSGVVGLGKDINQGLNGLKRIKLDSNENDVSQPKEEALGKEPIKMEENSVDEGLKSDSQKLILLIRKSLHERPRAVLSFANDSQNRVGIRWLLTQMGDEDIQIMQQVLGEAYFDSLSQVSLAETKATNLKTWLRQFTESLVLAGLKEKGMLESLLSSSELSELIALKPEDIFERFRDGTSPSLFRVLIELLPEAEFALLSKQFTDAHWMHVLASKDQKTEDLQRACIQILDRCRVKKDKASGSSSFKTEDFHKKLLHSVIQKFDSIPIHDEERFLNQLESLYPAVLRDLHLQRWFLEDLGRVPEPFFKSAIIDRGPDEIFSLILGLPMPWPEKIKNVIPEGTKKTIILDLVEKANAQSGEKELRAVQSFCRSFISGLRDAASQGRFQLQDKKSRAA